MSLDMLSVVCAAEKESQDARKHAEQKVQDAISESKKAGEEAVASTLARAESEIAHLLRASDIKATEGARDLASTTANRVATQRARAERRLELAAQYIIERIVNA